VVVRGEVGVGDRVDGDHLHVVVQDDPGPVADLRLGAEVGVGQFERDSEDVGVRLGVPARPGEVVEDPFVVGEEGVGALAVGVLVGVRRAG
ncbi:hypothetical protein PUR56_02570, partial [Streptomyces sp. BE303]